MPEHKIENGSIVIADTDYHVVFVSRTDLAKYGFQISDVPKYTYDMRMGLTIDLVKCMLSTPSFEEYARVDDIVHAIGTPFEDPKALVDRAFSISELLFDKAIAKGWMTRLDEDAMRMLREAKDESGFKGFNREA